MPAQTATTDTIGDAMQRIAVSITSGKKREK